LRETFADIEPSEGVTIEADPDLVTWLLPQILPGFLSVFAGFAHLRFAPLDPARVRANIAGGMTHFGLGFDAGEEPGTEPLGVGIGWHLLVPDSHRLAGGDSEAELGPADRVFLPAATTHPVGLDEFLRHVPMAGRIECGGFGAVRACVETEQGVGIVPRFVPALELGHTITLPHLSELRVVLYLPKDTETLSDPARALVSAIRAALQRTPSVALAEPSSEAENHTPELCDVGGPTP
jgi:DNA-binding transcriptional LysR family regulator